MNPHDENKAPRQADPETLYEMRAAFGPNEVVINVLTGERTDLKTGLIYPPKK